jgi:hypothetical protein
MKKLIIFTLVLIVLMLNLMFYSQRNNTNDKSVVIKNIVKKYKKNIKKI